MCIFWCIYVRVFVYFDVYMCVCIWIYRYICVFGCVYIYIYMCFCVFLDVYIYIYIYIYIYTYVQVYICVCAYMYVLCIQINTLLHAFYSSFMLTLVSFGKSILFQINFNWFKVWHPTEHNVYRYEMSILSVYSLNRRINNIMVC